RLLPRVPFDPVLGRGADPSAECLIWYHNSHPAGTSPPGFLWAREMLAGSDLVRGHRCRLRAAVGHAAQALQELSAISFIASCNTFNAPHKIVEFLLPAKTPITLQFSGSRVRDVKVTVTRVAMDHPVSQHRQ